MHLLIRVDKTKHFILLLPDVVDASLYLLFLICMVLEAEGADGVEIVGQDQVLDRGLSVKRLSLSNCWK